MEIYMKILLGLSGGVDSTYAALKLINEGHEVEAAILVMHEHTSIIEAEESAKSLGIPLHVLDCRERFKSIVAENFMNEYMNARTPNPCVVCNSDVKFKCLLDFADEHGFDAIATGHYAAVKRIETQNGERFAICRGRDSKKDQTYMLWRLPQSILSRLVLPLADMCKEEIREISAKSGLQAADRADSQEICFIPDGDYAEYIESRKGKSKQGNFVDPSGKVIARHRGIIHYTVGQRRGLGVAAGSRIFVTEINAETGDITLSEKDSHATRVEISGIVYSGMERPSEKISCKLSVKLRYAAQPAPATVTFDNDTAVVELDAPVRAVTPGQSCAIYDGDILVAGGFIDKAN